MKSIKLFFAGTLIASLLALSNIALAQTFGNEVRLSNQAGPSLAPTLAASGGNLYVAWSENISNGSSFDAEIYVRVSNDNGATWNAPINITSAPSRNDAEPVISASGSNVVIFWTDSQTSGEVYYAYSTNSGISFSNAQKLTTSSGYSRPTAALIDSGNRVHLAYYDNTGTNYGVVYYMCAPTVGGAFGAAVNLLGNDGVVDNEAPRLAQATDGTLYMMYRTSRNGIPQGGWPPFDQYVLRSGVAPSACLSQGDWIFPAQKISRGLPDELVNTYGGNISAGNSASLHAAWWNDKVGSNLYYRKGKPNESGWGSTADISRLGVDHLQWDGTAAELTGFGLGEDANNNVHFVFADRSATQDGYLTGNLYYTCINSSGTLQAKMSAKTTGAANAMLPRGLINNGVFHLVWSDFRDAASASTTGAEIYYRSVTTGSCAIAAAPQAGVSVTSVDFGGQSTGTTSPAQTITISNIGTGILTISSVTTNNTQFSQTNNCGSVSSGGTCAINVTFSPATISGAVNSAAAVTGQLSVVSDGTGSPNTVALVGTAEKSLVTHYYRSILRRAPDSGGKAYWESEALRLSGKSVNINEVWYAMAMYYYFSAEYQGFNRDNSGFVTDLYNTFFNRSPDSGGLAYWVGQIASGMPREVVLAGFMFSTEFRDFTQGIFGNTIARAEVDTVMDFYRGLLSRLPETAGLDAFLANFRAAQCDANPGTAVYTEVDGISKFFLGTDEYLGKSRTNGQYIGDLYNAFMRRGGDLEGVLSWISQLSTKSREEVRKSFFTSSEFAGRVASIVAYGCLRP